MFVFLLQIQGCFGGSSKPFVVIYTVWILIETFVIFISQCAIWVSVKSGLILIPNLQMNTHTHSFNGPFSGTTRVSRYQKGKTNLDFTEARDSEWQWQQLGHMQVCTSLQTDNHASTPPLSFFTGRMPFLPSKQQRQSTEGNNLQMNHV